jgi:hypothetical protein
LFPGAHYAWLDSAGPELCAALCVVAATTEATPLVFYCKAGKDRTGLVAAFSLHCCGAGDGRGFVITRLQPSPCLRASSQLC